MTSQDVSTKQQRIAELAERLPEVSFSSLAYHMDEAWMQEAYRRTRKDGAAGVDGQTAQEYEKDLEGNLLSLLNRAKSGTYKAPPVKRAYIPKGSDPQEKRPIGIPTLEDKVLQRAVVMLMEPLYEQDFMDSSYGFRPKRSAHHALQTIWQTAMDVDGGWVLEVDIRKYFETMEHRWIIDFVKRRVRDGVLIRLIGKWLHAGVMESGQVSYPEEGTPQGGVISPLLSNIYLHAVLDKWFERDIRPRLRGEAKLVRFADDFVILFREEQDARKVQAVLPKRMGRYGLTLHPEKTRLIAFGKPREEADKPGTFNFLGFTHYWGISRKGNAVVKRKTMKERLSRAVKGIHTWCDENRHEPVREQWKTLQAKLHGHYGYYGITGNANSLKAFLHEVKKAWQKWLNRRSRGSGMSWDRFNKLLDYCALPEPRVVHSIYAR